MSTSHLSNVLTTHGQIIFYKLFLPTHNVVREKNDIDRLQCKPSDRPRKNLINITYTKRMESIVTNQVKQTK